MQINPDRNTENKETKSVPPVNSDDIFTSRKHSMDYFTVDGVKLRTGYQHERDWYLLPIREILDNDCDFLTKNYRGSKDQYIKTWITKDDHFLHIKVRNSNPKDIRVFRDLKLIFDYDMRYGSKQNVYVISRGMLGDALKQILALGYVLIHLHDDGNSFTDEQWNEPLIIRHNRKEHKLYLHIDKANQISDVRIEDSPGELDHTDTEIEVTLPSDVGLFMPKSDIVEFCKKYPLFTTDISFEFSILDNSKQPDEYESSSQGSSKQALIDALSREPPKAITKIEYPAIHPISKERWTNSNSIWAYRPEEFRNRILNVHNKNEVTVYDVLSKYREGTNIAKTSENTVRIADLMQDPKRDTKMRKWYKQLHKTLDAPNELSLPYSITGKQRRDALVSRAAQLHKIDTEKEPSYKVLRGLYKDDILRKIWVDDGKAYRSERGQGIIQFPFVFEILALPLKEPLENKTEVIGAINYSVSPLDNAFEGDYVWNTETHYNVEARNIMEVLGQYGFHRYYASKSKLSCIIIANLVTPRRDPHGYDKSRIDMQPFSQVIADTLKKLAPEIPTFRAAGYRFSDETNYRTAQWHEVSKRTSVRELLKDFLVKERGLPE